jgi:hypothetical protein
MQVFTDKQVVNKIKDFVRRHGTARAAAEAAECTESQLSMALNGRTPCAKLLQAVGLQRVKVYTKA